MEILNYDEESRRLSVRYNTRTVWTYHPVTKEMYNKIMAADDKDRFAKEVLHSYNIVGTVKEVT